MAIKYEIEKHTVAFPTKVVSSTAGHVYNIELATATDNGFFVGRGEWLDLDLYAEAAAPALKGVIRQQATNGNWYVEITEDTDALFVYQVPVIAEEYNNTFKKISNFYNEAGDVVRAFSLVKGDLVEISAEGFTGTPVAGATVTVANKKLVVATA